MLKKIQFCFKLILLLSLTLITIAACTGAAPTAVVQPTTPAEQAMPDKASPTEEIMKEKATPEKPRETVMAEKTSEAAMGEKDTTKDAMMEHKPIGEAMPDKAVTQEAMPPEATTEAIAKSEDEAMSAPAWFTTALTNVNTGEKFQIADLKGKVVVVETMAVWCPLCLRQQKQVQALHQLLAERHDWVSIALDIDPNEDEAFLKAHAEKNGFDWHYAVTPLEVAREIGQLYGAQFLNPPSTPMLIIDRQGQAHPLPFGVKEAQTLQEALMPFLNES